ncbi:MAG: DUF599 domain-containing protein [Methylococcales bacterium]|nr:MAG: DUF599 domain-containing protein [Methylococcales bacterium]
MTLKYELISLSACLLLIVLYYLYLWQRTLRAPDSSAHSFNAKIRQRWVQMILANDNNGLLAIQTLRNSVMAANFMASTAILLIIGSLSSSEKLSHWLLQSDIQNLIPAYSNELSSLKLGLLVLDFFIAFYSFSMAIRFFNHVGYMIGLADTELTKATCLYLNKAGRYYTLGTRSFFFSLPIILWFFGPYFLILGTLILILGLALLDHVSS